MAAQPNQEAGLPAVIASNTAKIPNKKSLRAINLSDREQDSKIPANEGGF
jgi:hypothetical protein